MIIKRLYLTPVGTDTVRIVRTMNLSNGLKGNYTKSRLTMRKQVPADYYMMTFTLPAQLRSLAWQNQRLVYNLMFKCVWDTLKIFSLNDTKSRLPEERNSVVFPALWPYCIRIPES